MTDRPSDRASVLVIDDESGILDSLRILLKNEGFAPTVALGGKQGLEQLEALDPDIVLMSWNSPSGETAKTVQMLPRFPVGTSNVRTSV